MEGASIVGQDRLPCGIRRRETIIKVQLKLYMQPLSSPLPTTLEQYLPVSFPPTPLQILAQTPVDMGLTDRVHTRSGQSKRSLRSSGDPGPPSANVLRLECRLFRLLLQRKNISKTMELKSSANHWRLRLGGIAADATRAHFAEYANPTPGRRAIEFAGASMTR
jgi:hypothetical protein